MNRILVLFAHPAFERSSVHRILAQHVSRLEGITWNDLYQQYPEFDIDVHREQELLLQHDIIVWQHPFYWYSAPPILKQWQDLVLEHGWAYGRNGHALSGKKVFNVFTSGGDVSDYHPQGFQKYYIEEFLRPFQRTAELCRMVYWPPFWIPGTHTITETDITAYALKFRALLEGLAKGHLHVDGVRYMNDLVPDQKIHS